MQIKNAIAAIKKDTLGSPFISFEQLQAWFADNSNVPDDDNSFFIAKYKCKVTKAKANLQKFTSDDMHFNCMITSKRLLENAKKGVVIHADATYRVNFFGYPLLVFGTTDKKKSFHPIGFGLSSTENSHDYSFFFGSIKEVIHRVFKEDIVFEVLVSDAAKAIKKGFREINQNKKEVTCNYHVIDRCKKRPLNSPENSKPLLADIRALQLLPNESTFDEGWRLFSEKWRAAEADFVQYMKENWIDENKNWYEGVRHFTPSTNNAVESFNGKIKSDFLYRERPLLAEFKDAISKMAVNLSIEYEGNKKSFASKVTLIAAEWLEGKQWAQSAKNVLQKKNNAAKITVYSVANGTREQLTQAELNEYFKVQKDFDTFIAVKSSVWQITIPNVVNSYFDEVTCSCPNFFKNYKCKHAIGIGLRLHKIALPDSLKRVETVKRGGGRPKKARLALEIMQ